MRRSDRQINDFSEIIDVLRRADTVRVGLFGEEYPYVVPLSFGYETNDGRVVIYVHGAKEGYKHDLLAKNNKVCVEADIFHNNTQTGASVTTDYESVIGFGAAETVEGDEADKGMRLLLEHCGYPNYPVTPEAMAATRVIRIALDTLTGKRRFITDRLSI